MKKLLLFACLLALLAGCSKKEEPAPTPEPTPTVKISVLPTEINSTAEGGTFEIVVSSTLSWIVTSDQSWAVPSVSAGVNNGKFNIAVSPNTAKKEDVATVKITTTESDVATVTIHRAGSTPTETLIVSPTTKSFDSKGGQFSISVSSNTAWSVTSNQTWATLSTASGSGDGSVTVTVEENKTTTSDEATITIKTSTKTSTVSISRSGTSTPSITDVCGNTYPVISIGTQTWMAENLRCYKYDTQSEAYEAGRYTVRISTSNIPSFTPYYASASYKGDWTSTQYSGNLTDAQVAKLGYLYNWAAAVGVEDGEKYGTTPFTGNRQGICPNGWHVPSKAEWNVIAEYIDGTKDIYGEYVNVGKHLKTTSGWYDNGNGTDTYGFAALPAGSAVAIRVSPVGFTADFWTATPSESQSYYAYRWFLCSGHDYLASGINCMDEGQSVRCLKN